MATDVPSKWTDEELYSEKVSKKQIVEFLQSSASSDFLSERKLLGKIENVAKANGKEGLAKSYKELFETKAFRNPEVEARKEAVAVPPKPTESKPIEKEAVKKEEKKEEKIGYTKEVLKKGDNSHYPQKGDTVSVRYKGTLVDGTVFDQNTDGKKPPPPLKFKVGTGKVIRGWDEALLTMTVGEKAKIRIDADWAYGKKGIEGKIPPNSVLVFEVELLTVE